MLDIQVKHITLKTFSCFINEAWIQKDAEKLNCKDNSESALLSAVKVKGLSRILHLFFKSSIKTHPGLCRDWGIPRLSRGSGGEACQNPDYKGRRFLGPDVAQPGVVRVKEAALLPSCSKDANNCSSPARGPGASDKNEQSGTSAFCDCCPKNERGTFCCFSALGWKALKGFGSDVNAFVLCCFPQPTSSRHLKQWHCRIVI